MHMCTQKEKNRLVNKFDFAAPSPQKRKSSTWPAPDAKDDGEVFDGRTVGRTLGLTVRWTVGRTVGRSDCRSDGGTIGA